MSIKHLTVQTGTAKLGCCCAKKTSTTASVAIKPVVSEFPVKQLKVEGVSYGGFVKSIEKALRAVAGITYVSMDLASRVLSVGRTVQTDELIETFENVGYPATAVN
jgi:copper chaperone CopZ